MKSIVKKLMAVLSAVILMTAIYLPVLQASAASVKLNKRKLTLAVNQTYTLVLNGTKKTVTWKSSNKKVASVTKKGVVKGRKKGTATITATVGKKTYKCNVTVEAPKLSATKKTVTAGTSFTLKLRGTNRTVKWYTSNKKVATVKGGVVKTLKKGTVKITARVGGMNYTCSVTVKAKPSTSTAVTLDKAAAAEQYNALIAALKKEQNLTVKRDEVMNMTTDNPMINSIMGDDLNTKGSETYTFKNGRALSKDGTYYISVNGYIPPTGAQAALKPEHIKSAKLTKNSNGTSVLAITLVSEKTTYSNGTFSATPAQAAVVDASSLGDMAFGFDETGIKLNRLSIAYTATTMTATIEKDGKLSKLLLSVPTTMDLSVGMEELPGFDVDLVMKSDLKNTYTITY